MKKRKSVRKSSKRKPQQKSGNQADKLLFYLNLIATILSIIAAILTIVSNLS